MRMAASRKNTNFGGNPLIIVGAIALAGLLMFMANKRPAPQPIQTA